MCTKRIQASLPLFVIVGVLLIAAPSSAQMAKGANKYVGNITTNGIVRSDFMTYWNQITPENAAKWGSVEATQGVFHWAGVDSVAKFADTNKIPWKFHNLCWGEQQPSWITSLSTAAQLTAVGTWMDSAAARYPNVNMIDVVNEAYPSHAPAPYAAALGGSGETGNDWILTAFTMARQRWPNALLIYNDYNTIEYSAENTWMVALADSMIKHKTPISGIGCQAHACYTVGAATVKTYLSKINATGLPVFITEFDIPETNDSTQLSMMESLFPLFWNDSSVVGVTYWGYLVGATWKTGSGLLNTNGTPRPALTWLENYVKNNPNPPNKFPNLVYPGTGVKSQYKTIQFSSVARRGSGLAQLYNLQGKKIGLPFQANPGSAITAAPGTYVVKRDGECEEMIIKGHNQ